MTTLVADLRFALRSLARRPGFAAAAVLTLALAMAAVTGVAALAYGLIYRPLPGVTASGLMRVVPTERRAPVTDEDELTWRELEALRGSDALEGAAGLIGRNLTLTGGSEPLRVEGASVTPDFLGLLGVHPILGRDFSPDDGRPIGLEEVVMLSHGLWRSRYGGDAEIVGRTIEVNQRQRTVVAVLPPGFGLPESAALYLPFAPDQRWDRDHVNLWAVARLRPGIAVASAQTRLDALFAELARTGAPERRERGALLMPLRASLVDQHARRIFALLGFAVVAVLLVACSNVATLQLARAAARAAEVGVRKALGAGRLRVARLFFAEGLWLTLAGTVLGIGLGRVLMQLALASLDETLPSWLSLEFDWRLAAVCAAILALAVFATSLLPALRAARGESIGSLRGGRAVAGARSGQRTQQVLVASQFALSLVLLALAIWTLASLRALAAADIGFDPRPLLTARYYLPGDRYDEIARRAAFHRGLSERLASEPGVAAAATTGALPGDDGGVPEALVPQGRPLEPREALPIGLLPSSSGFFAGLGLPLLAGQMWSEAQDADPEARVAVINRALAQRLWPDTPPHAAVGREIHLGLDPGRPWLRVAGVAPDLVYEELTEQTARAVYQVHLPYATLGWRTYAVLVRAAPGQDPAALAPALRRAVAALEPDAPVYDVRPYAGRMRQTYSDRRLLVGLFAWFGALALTLAAVGVWGVVAYAASRRTREIGVRMALGARPRDVVRTLALAGLRPLSIGAVAGAGLVVLLARAYAAISFGVDPNNPMLVLPAVLLLAVAGAAAALLPARRAAKVPPTEALRAE
jgi:predicted permease